MTQPILTWIASVPDNSTLSFTPSACYRIEGTLEIRGRTGLDFEGNGAAFRSFNAPEDLRALWRVIGSTGFVFHNMVLTGSYAKGGTFTSSLQHAHAIDLRGSSADVGGITASSLGGDCLYFGLGYDGVTKSSGSFHDSSCSLTSRNGVAVSAGQNITVKNVTLGKIGYDVFDIEPNTGPGWGAQGITITGNTIGSYALVAYSIVPNAPISNQTFSNNIVVGKGLKIATGTGAFRPNTVAITGNRSDTALPPNAMNLTQIDGLTVTGNTVPMAGGTMAGVDNSCYVNVSGNAYPGGDSEFAVTNAPSWCVPNTTTTTTPMSTTTSPSVTTTTTTTTATSTSATTTTTSTAPTSTTSTTTTSTTTTTPSATVLSPPLVSTLPSISGPANVGKTLSASTGSWTGGPTGYAYAWLRCDSGGEHCAPIAGATRSAYVLVPDDTGAALRVAVTASNAAGSTGATSLPTNVIKNPGSK